MAQEHLATYLNDHLAGSVVALELLEHLEATHSEDTLRDFFKNIQEHSRTFHADIAADRDELEALMKALNIDQSRTRKASAWLAEKFTELKLRFDDPKAGAFLLYESLEALSLGIEGKRFSWIALAATAQTMPSLRIGDYDRLHSSAHRNNVIE
jgi:hypothetical protein